MRAPTIVIVTLSCLLAASSALAQGHANPQVPGNEGDKWFGKREKKKPEKTRSVSGFVRDPNNQNVEGAIVRLKDLKTLEVRSFITLEDGSYRFHGLSTETDYELKATHDDMESRTRRLTVYDSRKKANMNLKLKPKSKG